MSFRRAPITARSLRAALFAACAIWATLYLRHGAANAEEAEDLAKTQKAAQAPYTLGGYAEAFYQYNLGRPHNDITHYRGFDNRHNSFTLANVALSVSFDVRNVFGLIAAQVGHTPSTYYLSEPERRGTGATNETSAALWKYLQQAYFGYRFDRGLSVAAGLFFSPIGPEAMAIHENWNWSRSNLFFGLPFYHTGVRASWQVEHWKFTLAGYNGWNSIVDNNVRKSVSAQARYQRDAFAWTVTYFGGAERARGAPEGQAPRHQVDTHLTFQATSALAFMLQANAGVEPNRLGLSHWQAGAAYARARIFSNTYLAARGDFFREHAASEHGVEATRIFWPADWVASGTLTLDVRPQESIALMLEYRSDHAASNMYFQGRVHEDAQGNMLMNARRQNTLTLGATAWF